MVCCGLILRIEWVHWNKERKVKGERYLTNPHILKLKELGVLESFERNLREYGRNPEEYAEGMVEAPFRNFVRGAFIYGLTLEGSGFWVNISNK